MASAPTASRRASSRPRCGPPTWPSPEVAEAVWAHIPTRRTSTPEEVADAVVFLASDASRAITGEVLSADGGIHSTVNLWPTV